MSIPRRHPLAILWIAAVLTSLAACGTGGISGSGPNVTEVRDVDSFDRVDVGDGIGLNIRVGGAEVELEVSAQDNILDLISTTVEEGVLVIRGTESFTTSTGVTVTATVPGLEAISIAGGSQVQIDGVDGDQLSIDLSGGAQLVASGHTDHVELAATGGARADLNALAASTVSVNLAGGATTTLHVSDQVTGSASGGAVATIVGGAVVNVETSGGAVVTDE